MSSSLDFDLSDFPVDHEAPSYEEMAADAAALHADIEHGRQRQAVLQREVGLGVTIHNQMRMGKKKDPTNAQLYEVALRDLQAGKSFLMCVSSKREWQLGTAVQEWHQWDIANQQHLKRDDLVPFNGKQARILIAEVMISPTERRPNTSDAYIEVLVE